MANDKKNVKRLVNADDDPTAELETLVLPQPPAADGLETAASTAGYASNANAKSAPSDSISELRTDLLSRSETIDRLQFDLEALRAKWQGLATEIEAREEHTKQLHSELNGAKRTTRLLQTQLKNRDQVILSLQSQLQKQDDAYQKLSNEVNDLHSDFATNGSDDEQLNRQMLALQSGQLASGELQIRALQAQIAKTEDYADQLRYQLRLRDAESNASGSQAEALEHRMEGANAQIANLQIELKRVNAENSEITANLGNLHNTHAEEIRMIRFELGDAQETLTQHELVAEQLASDLVQTRGHRMELENMLAASEENSTSQIKGLRKENQRLLLQVENMTDKLQTKSEAINCLLAELAKNSSSKDPVPEIEDAIQEIDERMSEQFVDRSMTDRERVTRLLIGNIGGQELRFPLFKDRLTMGRTRQNDIQLKSEHISRRHAVVVIEGDVTRVIDWGSKNGVFVNSKRIKEHFLKNGDIVGVGMAKFRYEERPKRDS